MTPKPLTRVIVATAFSVLAGALVPAVGAAPAGAPSPTEPRATEKVIKRNLDRSLDEALPLWVEDEVVVEFAPGNARRHLDGIEGVEGAEVAESVKGTGMKVVELPGHLPVEDAVAELAADPAVKSVEPNFYIFPSQTIPNDSRWEHLWGLHNEGQEHALADGSGTASGKNDADIDAPEAWDKEQGDPQTVIAVVDTGVDVDHQDLNESLWINPGEIPGNGIDDDNNGYVDDVHGWDTASNDSSLLEGPVCPDNDNPPSATCHGYDHGTHVAGTIAAEMNNGRGVAGVCPGCKIMVLKFMRAMDTDFDGVKDTMGGRLSDELEALAYARKEKAHIINASFATSLFSRQERAAYKRLHKAGILTVAAAGNSSLDNDMLLESGGFFSPEYPASFTIPSILSVAASNHKDHYGYFTSCAMSKPKWKCRFTSWGHDSVDVAAPGVDVMSTVPGGYATFNGTSMAAPHVAGIAGLVKSQNPGYKSMKLKNAIMNAVDKPASLRKLHAFSGGPATGRFTRTSGRANADKALGASTDAATPPSNGNINGAKPFGKMVKGRVSWPADINDVFYKRLKKNKRYKVVLNGPDDADFDLVVWKPKTLEIWQLESGCFPGSRGPCKLLRYSDTPGTADESVRFKAKKSRKYYFHVSAWLHNSGRYRLKIKRI